jgi:pilus assembly protein Flp/PilA
MDSRVQMLKTGGQDAQSMIEYALILVLVAVVVVAVLTSLGTQITAVFTRVTSALGG